MDFGELLYTAQRNEHSNKKEVKCYKTKFEPPKKEQKSQKSLSTNIQKFLARKEEEERQRQEEAKKKREELLSLRAQDGKAKKRVAAMLKRTKAANKAAIADAVDNDNTAVTMSGLAAQPDEDDYGYVSQEAAAFYDKLLQKYHSAPSEEPMYASKKAQLKTDAKDLLNTKDRVRMALLKQEEEEMMPHKRKRKTKEEKLKEQGQSEAEEQDGYEEPEPPPAAKPAKPKRPAPPPLDFHELLKIAEKKQFEPIKIERKVKEDEDERPMTKKQRAEYQKELEWRMRKEGKLPPLSSGSQDAPGRRPQGTSRPGPDQGFKHPAARPMVDRNVSVPNRSQQSADRPRPPAEKGNVPAGRSRPQNTNVERSRPVDGAYRERTNSEDSYKDRNRTSGGDRPNTNERSRPNDGGYRERMNTEDRSRSFGGDKPNTNTERSRPVNGAYRERMNTEDSSKERSRSFGGDKPNTNVERSRPIDGGYKERVNMEDGCKERNRTFGGGYADRNRGRAPVEEAQRERARPSEDTSREKRQSESDYKDKYRSVERNQLLGKPRDKGQGSELQRSERSSGQAGFPRVPKVNNAPREGQINGSSRFRKLQGNADGKVGKERNMVDLFGDEVIKSNKNIPSQSALEQKKTVSSTNSKPVSYGKKLHQSLSAKLEERERARTGPSPAKVPKLQSSDDARGPRPQPARPLSKNDVGNARPPVKPATMQRPSGAAPPRLQPVAPKASRPPMVSKDMKPRPPDVKPRQFPPPDVRPRQFPPPDVRRKQFPPADVRRRPKPPIKRRIEDSDEDYDSELDDFIDDGPQEDDMDYSKHIKEIFGYDKSRYADVDDGDECMESSFSQQLKEEFVSTKLGIMEDLEDIRKEKEMEKRKKMKMAMKKRK